MAHRPAAAGQKAADSRTAGARCKLTQSSPKVSVRWPAGPVEDHRPSRIPTGGTSDLQAQPEVSGQSTEWLLLTQSGHFANQRFAVQVLSSPAEGQSMGNINKIDAVFAGMDAPQHPGAGLLVVDHNEIVYKKCYGLADVEAGRPVTADTSFYLGSISKQFTAMA